MNANMYIYIYTHMCVCMYMYNKLALCYVVACVEAKFRWTSVSQAQIWQRWGSCALVMRKQSQARGGILDPLDTDWLHSGSSSLADLRCHSTERYNGVGGRRCANFSHGAIQKTLRQHRQQFPGWSWTWMWTSCWLVGHPGTLVDHAVLTMMLPLKGVQKLDDGSVTCQRGIPHWCAVLNFGGSFAQRDCSGHTWDQMAKWRKYCSPRSEIIWLQSPIFTHLYILPHDLLSVFSHL